MVSSTEADGSGTSMILLEFLCLKWTLKTMFCLVDVLLKLDWCCEWNVFELLDNILELSPGLYLSLLNLSCIIFQTYYFFSTVSCTCSDHVLVKWSGDSCHLLVAEGFCKMPILQSWLPPVVLASQRMVCLERECIVNVDEHINGLQFFL
jgi:hypothetical protein